MPCGRDGGRAASGLPWALPPTPCPWEGPPRLGTGLSPTPSPGPGPGPGPGCPSHLGHVRLPWGPTGPSLPWAASSPPHPLRDPLPLSPDAASPGERSSAPTPPARGLPGRLGTQDGGPSGLGDSEGGGEISGTRRFLTVQEAPGSEAQWREGESWGKGKRFLLPEPTGPQPGSRARTARWPQGRAFGEASDSGQREGGVGGNQRTPQGEGRRKPVRKEDR